MRFLSQDVTGMAEHLAELSDRDMKTICKHINDALDEKLRLIPGIAKSSTVRTEEDRPVRNIIEIAIIQL